MAKRNRVKYEINGKIKYGNTICPICGEKKLKLPNDLSPQSMWGRGRKPRICQDCYNDQIAERDFENSELGRKKSELEWKRGKLFLIYPKSVADMTSSLKEVMETKELNKEDAIEYIRCTCDAEKAVIVHNVDELMKELGIG